MRDIVKSSEYIPEKFNVNLRIVLFGLIVATILMILIFSFGTIQMIDGTSRTITNNSTIIDNSTKLNETQNLNFKKNERSKGKTGSQENKHNKRVLQIKEFERNSIS